MSGDKNFRITRELELVQPEIEQGYPVSSSDWKRLRKKVEQIQNPSTIYVTIGGILAGGGISAAVTAFTLTTGTTWSTITWVIAAILLIVGILLMVFHYTYYSKQLVFSKDTVLECIETIECGFPEKEVIESSNLRQSAKVAVKKVTDLPIVDNKQNNNTVTYVAKLNERYEKDNKQPPPKLRSSDHVLHPTYGEGIVVSYSPKGDDAEVIVAFAGVGIKKLLFNFAHLRKIENI